ncbi:MAG: TylF/MycF family methyltransferase [Saprospiraceae bacterium]|nr:TylF/MycF family methyltransferase [Saprospiraceae bacterium]
MNQIGSLYIDLLKKSLLDFHRMESTQYKPLYVNDPSWKLRLLIAIDRIFRMKSFAICRVIEPKREDYDEGRSWPPSNAETMIGLRRLENIEFCVNQIIKDNIEGDFIETGVWRGGATIFMRALLRINNILDRTVWVADSFEGLPQPDLKKYPKDQGDRHYLVEELAVSLDEVKANFTKYDLLDDQVRFVKGWFRDTLPTAPIRKLALLRLDGDMYESTIVALESLYPKLTNGGFVIIDDWGAVEGCKKAVIDFRKKYNISEKIIEIDWTGIYWRKS